MQREIMIDVVQILGFNAPCAHHCLYCLMGKQQLPGMTFPRLASVAERFHDWIKEAKSCDFKIRTGPSFSANFDLETTAALAKLWRRLGQLDGFATLLMGGLPMRSQADMRNWLQERQCLGLKKLVPSLVGIRNTHDHYNRRRGDFEFLIGSLRVGAELGLESHQRLLLTKHSLPQIEQLIEILDSIPFKVANRSFYPLYYRGFADQLEEDRITEDERHLFFEKFVGLSSSKKISWHSEREWIERISEDNDKAQHDVVGLKLHLDASNIENIEVSAIESVLADLERRTRAAYAALPTRKELARSVGDMSNRRIYVCREDVERLWLDRYLLDHPIKFERELTYFH